ncbi:GNAT family N-acetyltransferase [Kribbella sp. NPDC055071]
MPILVVPTVAVHSSFLAAWDEFGPAEDRWMGARTIRADEEEWSREQATDPAEFARMVEAIRTEADEETELAPGLVHQTVLWFVDGVEFLGRLSIRHELTPPLLELGGHITYGVRPSARRQGHATRMLTQAVPLAGGLGIDPVLVTCDLDNVGSRKVIQAAGGELEDERHGKLRFWVPTQLA